jgi:hypothetical protein
MLNLIDTLGEEYWEDFQLENEDVEFLYNLLLEKEIPLTTQELSSALVEERINRATLAFEQHRKAAGEVYKPNSTFQNGQNLVFPALGWRVGKVTGVRPGNNPELGNFDVIQVAFEVGEKREFASNLAIHILNEPPQEAPGNGFSEIQTVLDEHGESLAEFLEQDLETHPDFVRIAGNWFPRALLVDINIGHLNLVEAVLDMAGGGPLPTSTLIEQIGLSADVNPKLLEFSLDWAMQNDARFDEVGPAGKMLWFLNRLEPQGVLEPPIFLRYPGIDYDRPVLTKEMLDLERELDDELSPVQVRTQPKDEVEIRLIYPHLRSGTLPLSSQVKHLFPTAYEAPRIRFMLVDEATGESFPSWVVRDKRYVFGLKSWYEARGLIPGSLIRVRRGKNPGEVFIKTEHRRATREWMRTVLVGSDGGVVFAMLKQNVTSPFDDRMAIAVPDAETLDQVWTRGSRDHQPLDRILMSMVRELSKLNPQGHVHASELYAAINIVRRVPPGPILALLASHPGLTYLGDLHYRLTDMDF